MPLPTLSQVWFWVLTVVCAGSGGYIVAYLRKKGENLATKEDFQELKEQTRALRETTKEIESKIDDQAWNRQRQWELTRDATLRVLEAHGGFEDATENVIKQYVEARRGVLPVGYDSAAINNWKAKRRLMIDSVRILQFACWRMDTSHALVAYLIALQSIQGQSADEYTYNITEAAVCLSGLFTALSNAIRAELGLQQQEGLLRIPTSQSSESSGAPTPD